MKNFLTKQQWTILACMYGGYGAMMISRQMITILSPALLEDEGLGIQRTKYWGYPRLWNDRRHDREVSLGPPRRQNRRSPYVSYRYLFKRIVGGSVWHLVLSSTLYIGSRPFVRSEVCRLARDDQVSRQLV